MLPAVEHHLFGFDALIVADWQCQIVALHYDFVNGSGGGSYVITNFRPGTDTIDLYDYAPGQQAISIGPASTVLSLSDGSKIQLLGVTNPVHSIIG